MTRITSTVHYVDGVLIPDTGTAINIYVVEDGPGLTVIDTGFPGTAPKIYGG